MDVRVSSDIRLIGSESEEFPSGETRLPIVRDVLRVLFFYVRRNHSVHNGARITLQKVLKVWNKTKVPRVQERIGIKWLEDLHKEWRDIQRHAADEQRSETAVQKEKSINFLKKLDKLFDLSKKDALNILEVEELKSKSRADQKAWEEERLFLVDQQGPRLYSMGGVDQRMKIQCQRLFQRQERTAAKEQKLAERIEKDHEKRRRSGQTVELKDSEDDDAEDKSSTASLSPEKKLKRGRINVYTPEVVEAMDDAKIGSTKGTRLISAVAAALGQSVKGTNANRRSSQRKRVTSRESAGEKIRNSFKDTADPILTVHWDGKKVPKLGGGTGNQERQAIVVTGMTSNQILAAPALPDGSAEEISKAVVGTLEEWNIVNNVKAMSFDTTSVNTGVKNGAALKIEKALGRKLVWLPCRHHIFELVLGEVYHEMMGRSTEPEIPLFREFKNKWESIDKSTWVTFQSYAASRSKLGPYVDETIQFAKARIEAGQPRNDYLELLEIVIIFLGGVPPGGIRFRPPGAIHSARWLAKAIYCIKMCIFRVQAGISYAEANRLLQVTIFVIRIYIYAWYTATIGIASPRNDPELINKLIDYEHVNKRKARAAQTKFLNHLWYLSEMLVAFAVFDEELSDEERKNVVMGIQGRDGEDDYPKKRKINISDLPLSLGELATTNTMDFFSFLGVETDFLSSPVNEWKTRNDYKVAKKIATHLKVVNDHGERGVKLTTDYNNTVTKSELSYQDLLLTVH